MKITSISPGYCDPHFQENTPQLMKTVQHHDCPPRLRHPFEAIEEAPRIKIPQTLLPLQQHKVQQTYAARTSLPRSPASGRRPPRKQALQVFLTGTLRYSGASEDFKRSISANGAAN